MRPDGEPKYTLYSHTWRVAWDRIRGMQDETERAASERLFSYLERGWEILRPLQLAAETDPQNDVCHWVDVEIGDTYCWMAQECINMLPPLLKEAETEHLYGEPPAIARNVRLLALMEPGLLPEAFRGIVAPAAEAFTPWAEGLWAEAEPLMAIGEALATC
jgi:hypothetical protein